MDCSRLSGATKLLLCYILFLCSQQLLAHDLGLHCLDGAHPDYSAPNIPAITGPFELHLQLRIIEQPTNDYDASGIDSPYTILTFSDGIAKYLRLRLETNDPSMDTLVWEWQDMLQQEKIQQVRVAAPLRGTVQRWSMGLNDEGQLWIAPPQQPKQLAATTASLVILPSTPLTVTSLGESFAGALLGIKLWHTTASTTQRGFRHLEHWNLPGQLQGDGFVSHFYARFDNLRTRQWQHVWDMGSATDEDNVVVAQVGATRDLSLSYVHDTIRHDCTAHNVLLELEMAFWHVGAEPNGTLWIQKNDAIVAKCDDKPLPHSVFRKKMRFGESASTSDTLDGVVLGFRVDLHKES